MDTVAQGTTWSDLTEPILDIFGVAVTAGGSFITVSLFDAAGIDRSSGVTVAHVTGGRYRISRDILDDGAVGQWGGTVTYDDGTVVRVQVIDFEVVASIPSVVEGTTLSDVRAGVARLCDDWIEVEATSTTSPSVVISAIQGVEADHYFRGAELLSTQAVNAANLGQKRRVADSSADDFSLTLALALPDDVIAGDLFHAFNIGGMGTRMSTYDAKINDVVRGLGAGNRILTSVGLADLWDRTVGFFAIPDVLTHVYAVEYYGTDGLWHRVSLAQSGDDYDYTDGFIIEPATKTIRLAGSMTDLANGLSLRVLGAYSHPRLVNDDDVTPINYDWLIHETAAQLLMSNADQTQKNTGAMYKNMADSLRAVAASPTPEGMIRVR